ncbi:DUF6178 family protein [Thermodesulfobacteriota bacterium]
MSKDKKNKILYITPKKDTVSANREIVSKLSPLSGSKALNMVLDHENPGELVKSMTKVDLFWLIKKVGDDDSFPLLSLASTEQWQYIMDMEIWNRDNLNMPSTFQWLDRLQKADPERLPQFLYSEDGSLLSHLFFSKIIDLKIKDNDDFIQPEGYITFDNLYYIKILAGEQSQDIEVILKNMALSNHTRFQALIMGIQGSIPSEIEEEMYRLKSVRLAEEGYLPFEEAAAVYAHLKSDRLKKDTSEYILNIPEDDDSRTLVPITPFMTTREDDLFAMAASGIDDYLILDRLRLEFGGLCNQILSADRVQFESVDDLIDVCRKAGGYINIGLEKLSEGSLKIAEEFIKSHPLVILFRTGFSQALELNWHAKKWLESSWFTKKGLDPDFWGNNSGGTLKGVLLEKPLYYSEQKEADPFRDFRSLNEIIETKTILDRMALLDMLINDIIVERNNPELGTAGKTDITIYSLLITIWIKSAIGLPEDFQPLPLEEAKLAFEKLRKGENSTPFKMSSHEKPFIEFFSSFSILKKHYDSGFIEETLSQLWNEFAEEYAMIETSDLDPKYSKYVLID